MKIGKPKNAIIKPGVYRAVVETVDDPSADNSELAKGECIRFTYELDVLGADGQPIRHAETYTNILIGTATLPKVVQAILGRELTLGEKDESFDSELVEKKPCRLSVTGVGRKRDGALALEVDKVLPATSVTVKQGQPSDVIIKAGSEPAPVAKTETAPAAV